MLLFRLENVPHSAFFYIAYPTWKTTVIKSNKLLYFLKHRKIHDTFNFLSLKLNGAPILSSNQYLQKPAPPTRLHEDKKSQFYSHSAIIFFKVLLCFMSGQQLMWDANNAAHA